MRLRISGLGDLAHLQPEGEVLVHRHVRKQRIVLEHHANVALFRRHVDDVLAVEADGAFARLLEAGDHLQRRRLAAA
jgi:hypothetical protein